MTRPRHRIQDYLTRIYALAGRVRGGDRAQSELLGMVLIIGMTVGGMGIVIGFGAQGLIDSQVQSQTDQAAVTMTQFDSQASLVALGGSTTRQFSSNFNNWNTQFRVEEGAGWMRVDIINGTTNNLEATVMNQTMGEVAYANEKAKVAFQGGGVWLSTDRGSAMISPPEYHFESTNVEPTLTLPLVVVEGTGDGQLESTVSISRSQKAIPKYPDPDDPDLSNPFDEGYVEITIQSQYYRAWGQFLEDRSDGEVTYDHDKQRVTAKLVSTAQEFKIESGLFVSNGPAPKYNHFHAKEDKSGVYEYNSSAGPLDSQPIRYGEVMSEGGIEIQDGRMNASTFVVGGGEVRLEKGGWTPGNLSYGGYINEPDNDGLDLDDHIRGWVRRDAQVTDAKTIGNFVQNKEDVISEDNDNDEPGGDDIVWTGDEWAFDDSKTDWNLSAGRYYINDSNSLDWKNGETLTLDLEDGSIELVVENKNWKLQDDARIRVINPGDNTARIYLAGHDEPNFEVTNGAEVTVEGDKATGLWVYGRLNEKTDFEVSDGSTFTGVFYAPGRQKKTTAEITKDSRVLGSVVAREIKLEDNASVYFDRQLEGHSPLPADAYTGRITYLHVSVNKIEVRS